MSSLCSTIVSFVLICVSIGETSSGIRERRQIFYEQTSLVDPEDRPRGDIKYTGKNPTGGLPVEPHYPHNLNPNLLGNLYPDPPKPPKKTLKPAFSYSGGGGPHSPPKGGPTHEVYPLFNLPHPPPPTGFVDDFAGEPLYKPTKDDRKKNKIPGEPGKDYPVFAEVPYTGFSCHDVPYRPGIYTNPEAQCQVYHVCGEDDRHGPQGASFLCPNGTLFNQKEFSCDWWFKVDCSKAKSLYGLNADPEFNPYYQKRYDELSEEGYEPSNSYDTRVSLKDPHSLTKAGPVHLDPRREPNKGSLSSIPVLPGKGESSSSIKRTVANGHFNMGYKIRPAEEKISLPFSPVSSQSKEGFKYTVPTEPKVTSSVDKTEDIQFRQRRPNIGRPRPVHNEALPSPVKAPPTAVIRTKFPLKSNVNADLASDLKISRLAHRNRPRTEPDSSSGYRTVQKPLSSKENPLTSRIDEPSGLITKNESKTGNEQEPKTADLITYEDIDPSFVWGSKS